MKDYKRLTGRDEFGNADIIGLDSHELASGLDFGELNKLTSALNRLADLEDKIERGEIDYVAEKDKEIARLTAENDKLRARLDSEIELPCKVGDTVWCIRAYGKGYQIEQNSVMEIVFEYGNNMKIKTSWGLFGYDKWTYGLDCFTDRTKAEAKLKELGGTDND